MVPLTVLVQVADTSTQFHFSGSGFRTYMGQGSNGPPPLCAACMHASKIISCMRCRRCHRLADVCRFTLMRQLNDGTLCPATKSDLARAHKGACEGAPSEPSITAGSKRPGSAVGAETPLSKPGPQHQVLQGPLARQGSCKRSPLLVHRGCFWLHAAWTGCELQSTLRHQGAGWGAQQGCAAAEQQPEQAVLEANLEEVPAEQLPSRSKARGCGAVKEPLGAAAASRGKRKLPTGVHDNSSAAVEPIQRCPKRSPSSSPAAGECAGRARDASMAVQPLTGKRQAAARAACAIKAGAAAPAASDADSWRTGNASEDEETEPDEDVAAACRADKARTVCSTWKACAENAQCDRLQRCAT